MKSWMLALSLVITLSLTAACSRKRDQPLTEAPPSEAAAPAAQAPAASQVVARPAFARPGGNAGPTEVSLADIAEQAVRSVVNISSTREVRRPGGTPHAEDPFFHFFPYSRNPRLRRARSLGSGVIVSRDGIVLTNNHVVADARQIRVTLFNHDEMDAEVVGTDPKSDLAVLRLKGQTGKELVPMPLGPSSRLRLGEVVLAIGNPFGLGQTVTMGIVSALGRANMRIVDYEDFIQTDAAINPGNSGGALVNLRGELMGINTAIASKSGGYQGIGFAIPSDMAQPIMNSLLQHGRVVRGWLGVYIQDLTQELAEKMELEGKRGVLVAGVQQGSPAQRAGLRRDDVITHMDGKPMSSVVKLRNRVAATGPGNKIKLSLWRGGRQAELVVTLGELGGAAVARLERDQGALGGLTVKTLDDKLRRALRLPRGVSGVVVTRVQWDSHAEAAGLREGDVILEFGRQPVQSAAQFANLYLRASGKILVLVFRKGTSMYMLMQK
jgi:serine protease Do